MTLRLATLMTLLLGSLAISACANTVRGVGADVGNTVDAGEAAEIGDAAVVHHGTPVAVLVVLREQRAGR